VTIRTLELRRGRLLAGKYVVEEKLGDGWEGEVYRVVERRTGIHRAAKLFYPERNLKDRTVARYACKLDRLRACPAVIQYHHSESIRVRNARVTCLISELVEGEMLSAFVERQPGRRLQTFEALHLLHSLADCLECVHAAGEYHGDLHSDNVLVRRVGIHCHLRILDFFYRGRATREPKKEDIVDAVRLFYEALGGRKRYAQQPPEIKAICRGMNRTLILKRFPAASRLRRYLETFEWTVP
jgi:serine/threonine protein kinase